MFSSPEHAHLFEQERAHALMFVYFFFLFLACSGCVWCLHLALEQVKGLLNPRPTFQLWVDHLVLASSVNYLVYHFTFCVGVGEYHYF